MPVAGKTPVVGGEGEELVLAEIRLDLQRRAEFARLDHAAEFEDRRLETALVAHAELHAGLLASGNGSGGLGAGKAERLLAEHVFAGPGGLHDLRRVQGMRCAEDHGLDRRVGNDLVEAGGETQPCVGGEAGGGRGRVQRGDDTQSPTATHRADDRAAPPAQAEYGSIHIFLRAVLGCDARCSPRWSQRAIA